MTTVMVLSTEKQSGASPEKCSQAILLGSLNAKQFSAVIRMAPQFLVICIKCHACCSKITGYFSALQCGWLLMADCFAHNYSKCSLLNYSSTILLSTGDNHYCHMPSRKHHKDIQGIYRERVTRNVTNAFPKCQLTMHCVEVDK